MPVVGFPTIDEGRPVVSHSSNPRPRELGLNWESERALPEVAFVSCAVIATGNVTNT